MSQIYLAVDGDNVGSHLEYLILTNQVEALQQFSYFFQSAMMCLEKKLVDRYAARIIFSGGDNLLACFAESKFHIEDIEELRRDFEQKTSKTLSVGLGSNACQAHFALKLAKSSGKNQTQKFQKWLYE